MNKRERQTRKALQRSLRNNPPLTPNAALKRRQRRLEARLAAPQQAPTPDYEAMTVPQLKDAMRKSGATGYSKLTKTQLIEALRFNNNLRVEAGKAPVG